MALADALAKQTTSIREASFVFWRFALISIALVITSACVGDRPALEPRSGLVVERMSALPAPSGQDVADATRAFRISPFDRLQINVYGVEDMEQALRVDSGGMIQVPLAGPINSAGLTLEQLSNEIAQRLKTYIRNPQVTVNLDETSTGSVTVYGQVQEPGQFPIAGKMTLMRAIALANGFNATANTNNVVVFRTVNNQDMAALYDLEAIRRGAYPDPDIYANDVIAVDDSRTKRLFQDVIQASPLLVTPIIVLLQQL